MSKKVLKTLKDLKQKDNELSGCLTPENGVDYNYSKGEPKYYTAYKVGYEQLRDTGREWIKWINKKESWKDVPDEDKATSTRRAKGLAPILYNHTPIEYFIRHFFNLEDD